MIATSTAARARLARSIIGAGRIDSPRTRMMTAMKRITSNPRKNSTSPMGIPSLRNLMTASLAVKQEEDAIISVAPLKFSIDGGVLAEIAGERVIGGSCSG